MSRSSGMNATSLLDAVISVDESLHIQYVSLFAEQLFGLDADAANGRPLGILFSEHLRRAHEDEVLDFMQSDGMARRLGGPSGEISALHASGREIPIEGSIFRTRTADGVRFTLMLRDITERKRSEEALRKSQAQLRLLVEQAPISIALLDRDLNYLAASRRWVMEYGRGHSDLIGLNHYEVHPDVSDAWKQIHRAALAGAILKNDEDHWIQADGSRHWLRWAVHPWTDEKGDIGGIIMSAEDITERKEAEQALLVAKEEAERANVAKTRFLAAVSHDLRQPLQTLSLLNGVLERKIDDGILLDVVGRQSSALTSMKQLLNVFMDMDRIATGVIKPVFSVFPVDQLLGELRSKFEVELAPANIDLRVSWCSASIRSDVDLLRRILQNLVSNALNYTVKGGVLIGCRRRGDVLRIQVWDTGPGIPQESLELIFQDFVQLANPNRQRARGSGLGLSVARSLSQLLGHDLNVRSTPGMGSVFSIDVPLAESVTVRPVERGCVAMVQYTGPPEARVLVVEDDPEVLTATGLLLKNLGLNVLEALSGKEGMARLSENEVAPDLIIVDYQLPDGSGIEIIDRARRMLGRKTPAMLVAGDTSPGSMRAMEASGYAVLHKPIRSDDLVKQMNQLLEI